MLIQWVKSSLLKLIFSIAFLCICPNVVGNSVDSLEQKLAIAKDKKEIILLHSYIAANYFLTNVDEAIAHCNIALKLSKYIDSDSLQIVCYKCLMIGYENKPYFEDSAFSFIAPFEALKTADNYPRLQSETYGAIASVYMRLHEYDKSILYQQKSVEKAQLTNNNSLIGSAKNNLGDLYRKSGQLDEALAIFKEVVTIGEKENNLLLKAQGNRGLGVYYDIKKDFTNAEYYFM